MPGILDGVKVVEVGHVVAIPAASSMMGDCGADVVKVEPLTGDQSRVFRGSEMNPGFYLHNRSKRAIAVNLKDAAGQKVVYDMVKDADVFLTNYRQEALLKLKMDYDSIAAVNPKIIYGIVTAYGTTGPDKDMPGYDFAAGWARSGIQYMLTVPGSIPPTSRPGIIDRVSSMQIFGGIAAALYHRERTGKGQKVEFNLYHTGVWMVGADIMDALVGVPLRITDPSKSDNPFYDTYKTKDDRWLQLTAGDRYAAASDPTGRVFWTRFTNALGRPDLAEDPRFATTADRQAHRKELKPMLEAEFLTRTYAEWEVRLRENDLMYGPILSPLDVMDDPQALANDFFDEIDQPGVGKLRLINQPIRFVQDPSKIRSTVPALGEHTDEVLSSLGYSAEQIDQMKENKVVR
jgi:crotonobetainyl-CoA:carnitine CoA-transferase CaiB-like acyl-CoA transferase